MARHWTAKCICGLAGLAVLVLTVLLARPVAAEDALARPTGVVILTLTGAIDRTNAPGRAEFDLAMLQAIGIDRLATSTDWTQGKKVFEGVSMGKLLAAVGAHGQTAVASALDGYSSELPVDDFRRYPVLLAWSMDGQMLAAGDKGPLWIIYPRDDYPELADPKQGSRWVWGLKTLEIK